LAGLPGVMTSCVGYTGGITKQPTYRNMGDHTETVEITYNPNTITYEELLQFFWKNHNPFTKNRRQYMSAIFCYGEEQLTKAKLSMVEIQKQYSQPICTVIQLAKEFYIAEDYHQKYLLRKHPTLLKSLKLSPEDIVSSYAASKLNAFINNDSTNEHFLEVCQDLSLSEDQITYIKRQMSRK